MMIKNILSVGLSVLITVGCLQAQNLASEKSNMQPTQSAAQVVIELKPDQIENRINDKVYGFLLEHIYHSVSNGIWGEDVWNRSFEELLAHGNWQVDNTGEVILDAIKRPFSDFRICRGRNYEISVDIKRMEGDGPVLIGMRDQNRERMLTNRVFCFLGADHNTSHKLEVSTGWIWHTPVVKTAVTDVASGSLKPGEWTTFRMRCDGNLVSAWIDGKQLFDRKIENCPPDGAITLGGENCRVAFRNVRVSALDGPKLAASLNPIRHWNLFGSGMEEAVYANVLNQDVALHIHSTGHLAGIEQPNNFSIRKNDALQGSVFLRGTAGEAYIQLLSGNQVISEQTLKGVSANWKEFPVRLPSQKDVALASLRILTREQGDLYIDQVSFMQQSAAKNQGFRVSLTNAVKALKPTILRWPGGGFVEQYRFEDGIGKQSLRKGKMGWDEFDPQSFGTDEFVSFCRKVGAEPQIVIPIGYYNSFAGYAPDINGKQDWLQRALDWLEYCNGDITTTWGKKRAANGHPEPYHVKYWEIDNEVWKMNPMLYAEVTRIFSMAMKKKDPEISIIGCGSGRLGREGIGLDSVMIHDNVAKYIDFISPHYYQTLDKYGNDGVEEYGRYLDKLAAWINESPNPAMKIYLSEWNLDGIDMRTGLFAGGFLNRLERTPKLEMSAPALFLRHTSAPGWNDAFINFDQNGWFPAPNYVIWKLWRDHYQPNRILLLGDTKQLNVIATSSDDKKEICVKIINPSAQPLNMTVKSDKLIGMPEWKVVSASSLTERNSMEHPQQIKVQDARVTVEGKDILLQVPAFSASILVIKQKAS